MLLALGHDPAREQAPESRTSGDKDVVGVNEEDMELEEADAPREDAVKAQVGC